MWLVDKYFDDTVTNHASILLNRISLNELLVIESTGITKTPPLNFKVALDQARARLQDGTRFYFTVDVTAARKIGIRPLLLSEAIGGGSSAEDISPGGDAVPAHEDLAALKP